MTTSATTPTSVSPTTLPAMGEAPLPISDEVAKAIQGLKPLSRISTPPPMSFTMGADGTIQFEVDAPSTAMQLQSPENPTPPPPPAPKAAAAIPAGSAAAKTGGTSTQGVS